MCSSVLHDQFEQTNFQVVHVKVRSLVKVACVELHIVPFIMVLFYFTVHFGNFGHQTVHFLCEGEWCFEITKCQGIK